MKVCVAGHRPDKLWGYDLRDNRYSQLKQFIKEKLELLGATEVYSGMAIGIDTLAAQAVLEMKDEGKIIKLIACIPCKDQDRLWPTETRDKYIDILSKADEIRQLSDRDYAPELMIARNHYMVDNCDRIITIINSDLAISTTGTQDVINYAEKVDKPCDVYDIGTGINKQRSMAKRSKGTSKASFDDINSWYKLDNFVVIDFETTGLSFVGGDRITDIGAFKINGNTIVSKYEQLVNPQRLIPADIQKLTGITDNMVRLKPTINQVLPVLLDFIGDYTCVFHNRKFDYFTFLKPTYDTLHIDALNLNTLCTLELDRLIRPDVKSHKLSNVYEDLTGKKVMNGAHRASVDALMTAEVAVLLRDMVRKDYNFIKNNFDIMKQA